MTHGLLVDRGRDRADVGRGGLVRDLGEGGPRECGDELLDHFGLMPDVSDAVDIDACDVVAVATQWIPSPELVTAQSSLGSRAAAGCR